MITDYGWWDTDITMIPYLKQFYNLEVHIIGSSEIDQNKFTMMDIENAMREHNISIKLWNRSKRIRSAQNLTMYWKMFRYIRKYNSKQTLLYYIYMYDPYINFFLLFNRFKKLISIHDYEPNSKNKVIRWALNQFVIKTNKFFHFYSANELEKFKKDYPNKQSFYTEMPLKNYGVSVQNPLSGIDVSNKRVFLFFGYIRAYKGLDLLLKALDKVNRTDYLLLIAGNADNWNEYKSSVERNPNIVANIQFVSNDQIPDYFKIADFLMLPYRSITQSGPVLIALNYNLPLISSDLPFFKSIVEDNKNGYLFEHDNVESLAEKIIAAIEMPPEKYVEMKAAQLHTANSYRKNVDKTGSSFYDFIKRILH
jgi:glycosyltransferase involved in cell wall biosynthesis